MKRLYDAYFMMHILTICTYYVYFYSLIGSSIFISEVKHLYVVGIPNVCRIAGIWNTMIDWGQVEDYVVDIPGQVLTVLRWNNK